MVCRVCLLSEEKCFNMFSSSYSHFSAPSIISKHFWFKPEIDDNICDLCFGCWEKIKNFHEFYVAVEAAQRIFQEELTVKKGLLQEDVDYEVKLHENVDSNLNSDNKNISKKLVFLDSNQSESEDLCTTAKQQVVQNQNIEKDNTRTSNKLNVKVSNSFTLSCDLCSVILPNFSELKIHFKKTHKIPGYVICCNKKFTQNQFLTSHIDAHKKPEQYKCEKCDKILSREKNYKNHMEKVHLKKVEYSCNNCPRKFATKSLLERHLPIHWSKDKWKVKCTYCEKIYPTEHFMKNHVTDIHEKCKICQFCGKWFSSRKFREHQRTHESMQSKVQCNVCEAWLKSKSGLKNHVKNHQEALEVHKCNICGKISPNKAALKIHVKNHQTTRCHQCSVCKKGFKRPLALRVQIIQHMASHTGESLYKCKYCTKSFIYDSAYHAHRKKEHMHEYLKDKKNNHRTNFSKFLDKSQEPSTN